MLSLARVDRPQQRVEPCRRVGGAEMARRVHTYVADPFGPQSATRIDFASQSSVDWRWKDPVDIRRLQIRA